MFNKSVASKAVLSIITIIFTTFIIIGTILSFWFRNQYFNQRKETLMNLSNVINKNIIDNAEKFNNKVTLKKNIDSYAKIVSADIYLFNDIGVINMSTTNLEDDEAEYVILPDDLRKLINDEHIEVKGDYLDISKEKSLSHIYPLKTNNGTFGGGVIFITNLDYIGNQVNDVYKIIWISCFVAIIFSTIIIYLITQEIIKKPLDEINLTVKKIEKGEVDRRVIVRSQDEIGQLASSFNLMADSIEKVENKRREFISNVSHELRSPITSIKGFIAGILDGIIPAEKEKYYLKLANEEILRLTRLINDLLDLSAMEEGKFNLVLSRFDINEIIRSCAIKFEDRVKTKKIKMKIALEDTNLFVYSDKDRVTQVLTNLIDNAIKYCDDSGNIEVSCYGRGEKVLISIYNTGKTFTKEEMVHIWERFYKSDKSRTSKLSTGLGLSITRNIMSQLKEEIWVDNKNNGVIFTFTIKRTN